MSMAERRSFLGVEHSVLGQRWEHALDSREEAAATRMAQDTAIPDVVCRVLAGRGVEASRAQAFFHPTIRDLMPDPSRFTDMDAAAARLADAIERRESIAIFGDYDVDGAASSALLRLYLERLGLKAAIRIPDRLTEGYGPNPAIVRELADGGATLVVTVDCGTTSHDALDEAKRLGLDVIVLDHHQTGPNLPAAAAIVNPNRQDDLSGQGMLCAAGVVFMTLTAVSRELRRRGRAAAALPDLMEFLDLVALATVCDVVPLVGLNRAFVVRGLAVMRQSRNPGLNALARVAGLTVAGDVYHLGYILGPRINAGGRIGRADLGATLLTAPNEGVATEIAAELHLLNEERQGMERRMLAEAESEVAAEIGTGEGPAILIAARDSWHPGIVGLIAARLKERYARPAVAIAFDATGRGTGSGRSATGLDLGALVRDAVEAGILLKGGGHAMAAGLTVERHRLGDFRAFAEEESRRALGSFRQQGRLAIDGALAAMGATTSLVAEVERAGPYGAGHAQPVFALPRHRIATAAVVGKGHVRVSLTGADGGAVSAIAFRSADTELGRRLIARGDPIHAAGTLSVDRYRGRETVSFRILDIANVKR
ncbi:single-stranded-DNA-specific exonuclease RecJ [Aureimonas leprariae]|uniref:Single-stranded-DNA-specific exonuclease RecJ n=1 Tax=Plantimonas leprariae TaxID=2615207 RepID=A0A7V7TXL6_9HYPH|nr:single-stranded-DNA-specific exonuclease RecJ [Aureimonas leprariae]KAB0680908.1 single-stranded-DNA-specific exonuclease RecJ [Aureimonas leprariae]